MRENHKEKETVETQSNQKTKYKMAIAMFSYVDNHPN